MITTQTRFDRASLNFFARLARAWGLIGTLLVFAIPAARGRHELIGWLPFWLMVAPALVMIQLDALMGFERARRWRRRLQSLRRATRQQARRRQPRIAVARAA